MKIAIDVTSLLTTCEYGEKKKFVTELLKGLVKRSPSDKFILLTSFKNHDLFLELENLGMQRLCVFEAVPTIQRSVFRQDLDFLKRAIKYMIPEQFKKIIVSVLDRLKRATDDITTRILRKNKVLEAINTIMPKVLKQNAVSVLFCPLTVPYYSEARIPTVSIVYDLLHFYYPTFLSAEELTNSNHVCNQIKKKVDFIICTSSFTRKTVIEKLNISEDRVFSIPAFLPHRVNTLSSDMTKAILTRFSLNEKKYCIYPANLQPKKNHLMLLVAFNMFIRKYLHHNLHLVLTGEKIENNEIIKDAVKQMRIEEKVHFLGCLPEHEQSVIWNSSFALIFPSLFEGFGIPLVEAMMFGKPILASNDTCIPEVAGDAAIYFNPRKPDEIVSSFQKLLENETLYNSLIEKGKEHLKAFDCDKMADDYLSVLHKAAQKDL